MLNNGENRTAGWMDGKEIPTSDWPLFHRFTFLNSILWHRLVAKMPRIENDIKLDFKDVLLRPKRSTLKSRSEVCICITRWWRSRSYGTVSSMLRSMFSSVKISNLLSRWISWGVSPSGTPKAVIEGFPSSLPIWTLWGPLRWRWLCTRSAQCMTSSLSNTRWVLI